MQETEPVSGEIRLELGGVTYAVLPPNRDIEIDLRRRYRPFFTTKPPELALRVHYGPAPIADLGAPLFESGETWALYRIQNKLVIRMYSPEYDPYQIIILDADLRHGDIYCVGDIWLRPGPRVYPLGFPLEEVIFMNLLAQGRGVLLHACGVSLEGQGIIFAGTSGAGKSTTSNLWEGQPGVTLLSDDRVIVRKHDDGRFWVYGTPWHGDARAVSSDIVPLERIYVIYHAAENRAVRIAPADAASRLLVRAFPTFWDAEGMAYTLSVLGELSETVPCYELGFVPDQSIVDFVRCQAAQ
ncbi:MAG: hypothetical protein KKA73_27100 [Chloroflexi bacterium]|nr:hypothetical protein [Chloroflexota bacterium]MBU1751365.1 hypothetical protein [Chloroflexota bacterium]